MHFSDSITSSELGIEYVTPENADFTEWRLEARRDNEEEEELTRLDEKAGDSGT